MKHDCPQDKDRCHVLVHYLENTLHDIKTPISIIEMMLQNIEGCITRIEVFGEEQRRCFETTKKYTSKIIDILQEMNGYYKIKNHIMTPQIHRIDILALINETVELVAAMAVRKGIRIIFNTRISSTLVYTDGKAVERIMSNLLSNAVKFSPMGAEITVNLYDNGDVLGITVADSGEGFTEMFLREGVRRYSTIENEHNPNGSGIGLFVVQELVSALKGTVEFANGSGGAVVTVSLPMIGDLEGLRERGFEEIQMELE